MDLYRYYLPLKTPCVELPEHPVGVIITPDETDISTKFIHIFKKDMFKFSDIQCCSFVQFEEEEMNPSASYTDSHGILTCFNEPLEHAISIGEKYKNLGPSRCILEVKETYAVACRPDKYDVKPTYYQAPIDWFDPTTKDFDKNMDAWLNDTTWKQESEFGLKRYSGLPKEIEIYNSHLTNEENTDNFLSACKGLIGITDEQIKDRLSVYTEELLKNE